VLVQTRGFLKNSAQGGAVPIPDKMTLPADVYVQLERIRQSSVINMMDRRGVQQVANSKDFYALVVWIEDTPPGDYMSTVFVGTTPDRALTEDEEDAIAVAAERGYP
jgi:hypothetical protein